MYVVKNLQLRSVQLSCRTLFFKEDSIRNNGHQGDIDFCVMICEQPEAIVPS